MTITHIIILLATGIGVGFASGLLGVGGGFIVTPIQYMVFTSMGVEDPMKLAIGTSLAVVLPTALSGTWRHNKKGAVWWKPAIIMGICSAAAAFGGARLAIYLPEAVLKMVFGIVVLFAGIRMLIFKPPSVEQEPRSNPWLWAAWAIPVGLISSFTGVGGGIVAVPIMMLALRFKMHTAVATSLAMVVFTSIGGLTGYIMNGWGVSGIPSPNLGYVHIWSWLALATTSIGMAQVGAITAHQLPAKKLRYMFVLVVFFMGGRMLWDGVQDIIGPEALSLFNWLGWPV